MRIPTATGGAGRSNAPAYPAPRWPGRRGRSIAGQALRRCTQAACAVQRLVCSLPARSSSGASANSASSLPVPAHTVGADSDERPAADVRPAAGIRGSPRRSDVPGGATTGERPARASERSIGATPALWLAQTGCARIGAGPTERRAGGLSEAGTMTTMFGPRSIISPFAIRPTRGPAAIPAGAHGRVREGLEKRRVLARPDAGRACPSHSLVRCVDGGYVVP